MEDLFGIKPYGEALKISVEKAADGVGAFLAATCMPAAEEFGLMLKDRFRYWRLNNVIRMIEKTKGKYEFIDDKLQMKVNPRIGIEIIENASWQEDDTILEMWAGLLASSMDKDGSDDSNIVFINLLKSLTAVQCRMLNHICCYSETRFDRNGLIYAESSSVLSLKKLYEISGTEDLQRLDREIDHLRSLALLPTISFLGVAESGFLINQEDFNTVKMKPTPLALNLYSKASGYRDLHDCFPNAVSVNKN